MKLVFCLILELLISVKSTGQGNGESIKFKSRTIGTQEWMVKNLDVVTFRNGDSIREVRSIDEWYLAGLRKEPAWCYYENDSKMGERYGKLYNWFAVVDPRGLAPDGWHIPSNREWEVLHNFIGSKSSHELKSRRFWKEKDFRFKCFRLLQNRLKSKLTQNPTLRYGRGSNRSGFRGLPGGRIDYTGYFHDLGSQGLWWSTTDYYAGYANNYTLYFFNFDMNLGQEYKESGLSVRCVKD